MPARYNFKGKVALVTGSSSGIGKAIAIQLAKFGARVAITGRDADKLTLVARQVKKATGSRRDALQVVGDFGDPSFARRLFTETIEHFGRLDFLINNAGAASGGDSLFNEQFMETFDSLMTLNVRSALELIHLAVPELMKTNGNVVNISSVASVAPVSGRHAWNDLVSFDSSILVLSCVLHLQGCSGHDNQDLCQGVGSSGSTSQFDQVNLDFNLLRLYQSFFLIVLVQLKLISYKPST